MALPPKFQGHRYTFPEANAASASGGTVHTLEFYLDYVCPFSAKLFKTLNDTVIPHISKTPELASRLQLIFRHQIQPWHPSSTLTHEAALAVNQLLVKNQEARPSDTSHAFWAFSRALFEAQLDFFDDGVVAETRNQTYRRLAALAQAALSQGDKVRASASDVYALLEVVPGRKEGQRNAGNAATNDLKQVVKIARQVGVHVSPTVLFNGVEAREISSGWTGEQWTEWLEKNIV